MKQTRGGKSYLLRPLGQNQQLLPRNVAGRLQDRIPSQVQQDQRLVVGQQRVQRARGPLVDAAVYHVERFERVAVHQAVGNQAESGGADVGAVDEGEAGEAAETRRLFGRRRRRLARAALEGVGLDSLLMLTK